MTEESNSNSGSQPESASPVATAPVSGDPRFAKALQSLAAREAEGSTEAAPGQQGPAATQEAAIPSPEPTAATVRAEFLSAQKAQRKAQAEMKQAREMAQKADQFKEQIGSWKSDPMAFLTNAGIDPTELYREMTNISLGLTPKADPVESKIKEALHPYLEQLNQEKLQREHHETLVAESNVIASQVMPNINLDNHEALVASSDGSVQEAAITVYKAVKQHYIDTGEVVSFEDAANQLENYWADKLDMGISKVKGMKKFQKYFGTSQPSQEPKAIIVHKPESKQVPNTRITAKTNNTLTNKQNVISPNSEAKPKKSTGDPRLDRALGKFGY